MSIRLLVPVLFILALCGCTVRNQTTVDYSGETMGTTYSVTAGVFDDQLMLEQDDLEYMLWDINQSLSTYEPNSLISRINASRDTAAVQEIDVHFMTVFRHARNIYEATSGAFNPAVGPLVRAWGFGADEASVLDSVEVERLVKLVDFSAFQLDENDPPTIKKRLAEAELDFSAIAKGYAVDEIGRLLEGDGIFDYLVEIGGEVRARGRHPEGRTWRIGIEMPLEAARDIQAVVELTDLSMATSGNYRNFYRRDGQKFVHTINPQTGYPELNRLLSATVIATDCMTADAYATALMVMGYERSISFSETPGGPDMYLIAGGDSTAFEVFATPAMSRFLVPIEATPR